MELPRHPHRGARFCPGCRVGLGGEGCAACGAVLRLHPRVCSSALPERDGRVLLVRRDIEPQRGLWQVPGGFMELGETAEEAAIRELREEALLEVRVLSLLGVYTPVAVSLVVFAYEAEALGEGGAGHECQEVRWFAPGDIPWAELAFWSTEQTLRDWMRRHGLAVPPPSSYAHPG